MLILYRLGIWFYWTLAKILSPFQPKARKFVDGRKNWKSILADMFQNETRNVVWFHAASLGEFEQGRPVIEELKKRKPEIKVLLTFFSPSGYETRKNYNQADWIIYLPLDTPSNADYFIKTVKPRLAVFIKYEFWFYFLKALNNHKIPTLMISCVLRPNQFYFKPYGRFFHSVLRGIRHYFMQDETSMELAKSIQITQTTLAGDTRFDRVLTIASDAKDIPIMKRFKGSDRLMVLGSTWQTDIKHIKPLIELYQDKMKFVIAPHNIGEEEIEKVLLHFPDAIRFSKGDAENSDERRIMIIDNMGMLSSLYRYGDFAFIGGAFRGALHNTLEAAVYGIPVCFGEHPKNMKFKEAIDLVEAGGAFTFNDSNELMRKFEPIFNDQTLYESYAKSAGRFVKSNAGATELVIEKMIELI